MINKRTFNVSNTKKILHKVGKQWLVISAVLLGLIAGGAALTGMHSVAMPNLTAMAHADGYPTADANGTTFIARKLVDMNMLTPNNSNSTQNLHTLDGQSLSVTDSNVTSSSDSNPDFTTDLHGNVTKVGDNSHTYGQLSVPQIVESGNDDHLYNKPLFEGNFNNKFNGLIVLYQPDTFDVQVNYMTKSSANSEYDTLVHLGNATLQENTLNQYEVKLNPVPPYTFAKAINQPNNTPFTPGNTFAVSLPAPGNNNTDSMNVNLNPDSTIPDQNDEVEFTDGSYTISYKFNPSDKRSHYDHTLTNRDLVTMFSSQLDNTPLHGDVALSPNNAMYLNATFNPSVTNPLTNQPYKPYIVQLVPATDYVDATFNFTYDGNSINSVTLHHILKQDLAGEIEYSKVPGQQDREIKKNGQPVKVLSAYDLVSNLLNSEVPAGFELTPNDTVYAPDFSKPINVNIPVQLAPAGSTSGSSDSGSYDNEAVMPYVPLSETGYTMPAITSESETTKPTNYTVVPDNKITITGVAKKTKFYVGRRSVKVSPKAAEHAVVLSAYYKGNKVMYTVKVGKLVGHVYGRAKAPKLTLKHGKLVSAYRKGNLVKYTVKVGKKDHFVYKTLTKVLTGVTASKYHTHSVTASVAKPVYIHVTHNLMVHTSKHFTKKNGVKSVKKGMTVKVVKLVHYHGMTRFVLSNGGYVTGLRSYIEY